MLPGHSRGLDCELGFSFDDKAIETLSDQRCHSLGNIPDDSSLNSIGQVNYREQPIFKDWIWIEDQDTTFHKNTVSA
jgi:hypothetical protein